VIGFAALRVTVAGVVCVALHPASPSSSVGAIVIDTFALPPGAIVSSASWVTLSAPAPDARTSAIDANTIPDSPLRSVLTARTPR
jgi:hypothetical protein